MKKLLLLTAAAIAALAAAGALAHARDGGDRGGDRWTKLDANGDGKVTLDELDERHREFFSKADADGDGALTKEEMRAFHNAKAAERAAKRLGDADGDGAVDKKEYNAAAAERFKKLDADGDGVISADEMAAGRGKQGRRGPHGDDDKDGE